MSILKSWAHSKSSASSSHTASSDTRAFDYNMSDNTVSTSEETNYATPEPKHVENGAGKEETCRQTIGKLTEKNIDSCPTVVDTSPEEQLFMRRRQEEKAAREKSSTPTAKVSELVRPDSLPGLTSLKDSAASEGTERSVLRREQTVGSRSPKCAW